MSTMTLTPMEQLSNGHVHGKPDDQGEMFAGNMLQEFVVAPRQHPAPQHTYPVPTVYVSHALPAMPMEGDGRTMAMTIPPSSVVPVSVPLRQAVMYPAFSNCATVYPTATRGSFSTSNRRYSGGSGEISAVESPTDDGSHDDTPNSGKVLQEVCRYFMRTGTCGYGDKCRYHHPQSAHRPKLNSMGYPQREAEHACPFYLKNGWCGFGATCKFNHPELPPLNVPTATTLVPQMLAPVPYSTIPPPPYASVPPGGPYSTVTPSPATPIMHWPVTPAGVHVNVSPPPQSGMYHHQSYMSLQAVPTWPMNKDQQQQQQPQLQQQPSMTLGSHGTASPAQRMYSKPTDSHQEAVQRHTSPKSEDSAFSVVGRDVSLRRHHHPIGEETKHVLMPVHPTADASHVSVTTA